MTFYLRLHDRRKLFYGGGLCKNVGWPTFKNQSSQKRKIVPKHKWFKISYLKAFFWKYFLWHTLFYIHPHVPADIIRVFFNFRLFSRKSQSQQKLLKKITQFTTQFRSKNLTHFWASTHLTFKIIYCWNTAKNLSEFTKNFQTTMFLFGVRKNICTPPFLDGQNCILEALWRQMSVYFCFWGSLGESE